MFGLFGNRITGWWFQPISKIWVNLEIFSPNRGENKKYLSCNHLVNIQSSPLSWMYPPPSSYIRCPTQRIIWDFPYFNPPPSKWRMNISIEKSKHIHHLQPSIQGQNRPPLLPRCSFPSAAPTIWQHPLRPIFQQKNTWCPTFPETNIAPEHTPLVKEIPIGNHHF